MMCPRLIEIQCGASCSCPNMFGSYFKIDTKAEGRPVYYHQDHAIDGALWYFAKIGWLIGEKKHVGTSNCKVFTRMGLNSSSPLDINDCKWVDALKRSEFVVKIFKIVNQPSSNRLSQQHAFSERSSEKKRKRDQVHELSCLLPLSQSVTFIWPF